MEQLEEKVIKAFSSAMRDIGKQPGETYGDMLKDFLPSMKDFKSDVKAGVKTAVKTITHPVKAATDAAEKRARAKTNEGVEQVDEGKTKIGEYSTSDGKHSAKVYKLSGADNEGDPYHVKYFKDGKHHEAGDYFTNDEEDAHGTAKHMCSEGIDEAQRLTSLGRKMLGAATLGTAIAAGASQFDKTPPPTITTDKGEQRRIMSQKPTHKAKGIIKSKDGKTYFEYEGGSVFPATK